MSGDIKQQPIQDVLFTPGEYKLLINEMASLRGAVEAQAKTNSEQHQEIKERLFGTNPMSLQSQISDIELRAFGDNPVSLRSQIIDMREKTIYRQGMYAILYMLLSSGVTLLFEHWHDVTTFFSHMGH